MATEEKTAQGAEEPEVVNLGTIRRMLYDEYLEIYGDEELANLAAAATLNELIAERAEAE